MTRRTKTYRIGTAAPQHIRLPDPMEVRTDVPKPRPKRRRRLAWWRR